MTHAPTIPSGYRLPQNDSAQWFSVKDVAGILDCHPETIRRHCESGDIPHTQLTEKSLIRIHRDTLERLKSGELNWNRTKSRV